MVTLNQTLQLRERWDQQCSIRSRPLDSLRNAMQGLKRVYRIDIPKNVWSALTTHPEIQEVFKTYRDEPAFKIAFGRFCFEWRGLRRPGLQDLLCDVLQVPRGSFNILEYHAKTVLIRASNGTSELREVVE